MSNEFTGSYELERNHMETILNNRFNFLFISVGLFLNAAVQSGSLINYRWLLIISLIYTSLLSLTLFRAQARLNFLVDKLNSIKDHPVNATYTHLKDKNFFIGRSVRNLVGYWIPIVTILVLLLLLLFPSFIFN